MRTMIDNEVNMSANVGLIFAINNPSTRLADLMEKITQLLGVDETYNMAQIIQYMDEYDPLFLQKYTEGFLSKVI